MRVRAYTPVAAWAYVPRAAAYVRMHGTCCNLSISRLELSEIPPSSARNHRYCEDDLLATSYWLLATGYWLLATGYWLLATDH